MFINFLLLLFIFTITKKNIFKNTSKIPSLLANDSYTLCYMETEAGTWKRKQVRGSGSV